MVTLNNLQRQYDNMLPCEDDYDDARVEQIVDGYLKEWSAADLLEILSGNILEGVNEALKQVAIKQSKKEAAEAKAEYEYNLRTWND